MRKNSFMEGAFIATFAIFLVKIMGILYVIPFYSLVGLKGAILYGYAYSIYVVFLNLSTGGIPIAVSKAVSEYNTMGYYNLKEKIYKISAILMVSVGFVSFLTLFAFAPALASTILGQLEGGNTIEEVTLVIRVVSTALLIVPLLSVTKGYLQGHKFIYPSSVSMLLEQVLRVTVIILGSYIVVNLLGYSIETGVAIAVFGATLGALFAYLYLAYKIKTNKESLLRDQPLTREEAKTSNKQLIKLIISYALPFIFIDILKSSFHIIDTLTVVSTMVSLGNSELAEVTVGVITSLGSKLNMIIISISIGITVSLVPNIASSFVKKNFEDINRKINQTLQAILFVGLPMTIGLFFLVQPAWVVFYSYDETSIAIFSMFVFQALVFSIFSILIKIFQTMNNTKVAIGTLLAVFATKAMLNIPAMNLFNNLNWPIYYAPITLTLILQGVGIVFLLKMLNIKYDFKFGKYSQNYIKIAIITAMMFIILRIFNLFIPITAVTKSAALLELIAFILIGGISYLIITFKSGLIYDVFGKPFIDKILSKLVVFQRK